MAHVNPDPHAQGYIFIPTNRVTGVFSSYDDLQGALRALEPLGFDPQHIDVFAGPEGAELLDLCGQRHGVATWMLRNIAALVSDDATLHQQADATLRAGGGVIGVLMDDKGVYEGPSGGSAQGQPCADDSLLGPLDHAALGVGSPVWRQAVGRA